MTRIIFLGTPEPAVPSLLALAQNHEVRLVITQPDRPRGRSSKPRAPAVKEAAMGAGLAVSQPESSDQLLATLAQAGPVDLAVVVAYGRILRKEVLDVTAHGMLNVHFSLLPRWRGAAPVNRAIMAGDSMTGVTIIKIDEGLDTGPVLTAQAIDIRDDENAGELTGRLARLGGRLVADTIEPYLCEEIVPQAQSNEGLTYASKLASEDRPINLERVVTDIIDQVRGLSPIPGATLQIDGDVHKILRVSRSSVPEPPGSWSEHEGFPVFGAGDGAVRIEQLQPPGRRVMSGPDWVRGRPQSSGLVGE